MIRQAQPPVAARRPITHERFGIAWTDDYAWLRDKAYPTVEDPDILGYLRAENEFVGNVLLEPERELIAHLHDELKARLKDDDSSVPVRQGNFDYHWAFKPGAQYRTWYRRSLNADEPDLIIDENKLAQGTSYFNLRSLAVSPDGRMLAYATDHDGSERYRIHVSDLITGAHRENFVTNVSGSIVWREDSQSIIAVDLNDRLRPFRVREHAINGASKSQTLFEEKDAAFFVSIG